MHIDLQTTNIIGLMGTCDTLCYYLCSILLVMPPLLHKIQQAYILCSLQLMLLLMPKKPIYAVVRASIMGQGLFLLYGLLS